MYYWGITDLVSEPGLDFLEDSTVRNYRVRVVVTRVILGECKLLSFVCSLFMDDYGNVWLSPC